MRWLGAGQAIMHLAASCGESIKHLVIVVLDHFSRSKNNVEFGNWDTLLLGANSVGGDCVSILSIVRAVEEIRFAPA